MTFKLVAKAKFWKACFAALKPIHDEVTFVLKNDGILIHLFNHWEGIYFTWPKEKFSTYEVGFDGADEFRIGLTVGKLYDIVKRFDDDADLEFLNLLKGCSITSGTKQFTIEVLADPKDPPKYPRVPYTHDGFDYSIKQFKEIINDAQVVGVEQIDFETHEGKLYYVGKDYGNSVKEIMMQPYTDEVKGTGFKLEFLQDVMSDLTKYVDDKIRVRLGTGFPLLITMTIPDFVTLEWFVAPMVAS